VSVAVDARGWGPGAVDLTRGRTIRYGAWRAGQRRADRRPTPPMFTAARRFEPQELGALDLDAADPRIVWATAAKASSEWGSSYAASTACGPPCIYPNGGDEHGSWLAASGDRDPWIELTFPVLTEARGILVCETCGPGAVREIRDVDRDAILYAAPPERIADSRSARLLFVPLPAGTPAPARLRLRLARTGTDYHEIDAVAVVTAPVEAIVAEPVATQPHRRYSPDEVTAIDLGGDWRLLWATRARASSEWSESYAARTATGRPRVFPRGGDVAGAWLSASGDRKAWLELEFGEHAREHARVHGLIVVETCGAGAVIRATDERDQVLFRAKREPQPSREARLLHVAWEPRAAPRKVRLWVSSAETDYREIDAVALLAAPFEELFEPPPPRPPPPPPPVPGAPADGFTILEGVLAGASHESPFVHATVRARDGGRAANHGGPLTLRLDSGDEVALETGRTTIYGGRFEARTGTWAKVAGALPWLAAPFAAAPPDGEVRLEGTRLDGDDRVWVAGTPRGGRWHGGYREAARHALDALDAVAISRRPLAETDFGKEGTRGFDRRARPHPPEPVARPAARIRHPLARPARATAAVAVSCLLAITADVAIAAGTSTAVSGIATLVGLYAAIVAIDLAGRIAFVPSFLRGPAGALRDRRPPFGPPRWTLIGVGAVLGVAAVFYGAVIAQFPDAPVRAALAHAAPLAVVFLWRYARSHLPALAPALRLALSPRGRLAPGGKGRFTGTLAEGQRFTRVESLEARSEHLGTESYADADGRVSTYHRYRNWLERATDGRGPSSVRLQIGEAVVVTTRTPRTTHLAIRCAPPGPKRYAELVSEHAEGDVATLLGTVSQVDGETFEIEPTHLVFGDLGELRRRAAAQLLVLVALTSIVAAGVLAVVL
jgi:hypothetical protein